MKKHIINIAFIFIGLAVVAPGIYLATNSSVGTIQFTIGIALVPVGTSATISAIKELINEIDFIHNEVVALAYKVIKEYMRIVRYEHKLELELTHDLSTNMIAVTGKHEYVLKNLSIFHKLKHTVSIYTDIGRQSDPKTGGFKYVRIGTAKFDGAELEDHIVIKHQKKYFIRDIAIDKRKLGKKGNSLSFEYQTFGVYCLQDRLIWTVQDLSHDFTVVVKNRTPFNKSLMFKFNHSNEEKVIQNGLSRIGSGEYKFSFGAPILPYQGFEMAWDFSAD